MSIELTNETGLLGQVASNAGYSDLIESAKGIPVLKTFFQQGATEDVPPVVEALKKLDGPKDVLETAFSLAKLMEGQELVIITDGTSDDEVEKGGPGSGPHGQGGNKVVAWIQHPALGVRSIGRSGNSSAVRIPTHAEVLDQARKDTGTNVKYDALNRGYATVRGGFANVVTHTQDSSRALVDRPMLDHSAVEEHLKNTYGAKDAIWLTGKVAEAENEEINKMKLSVIHFGSDADLPASVRNAIPSFALSVFRNAFNEATGSGKSEMNAYIKGYRALEDAGYVYDDAGKWSVKKDGPTLGTVHINRPLGRVLPKDQNDPFDEAIDDVLHPKKRIKKIDLSLPLFEHLMIECGDFTLGGDVVMKEDQITVDVPLFIRLLELAREDIKTDPPIHEVTEKITELMGDKTCLDMDDYEKIVSVLKRKKKEKDDPGTEDVDIPDDMFVENPPAAGQSTTLKKRISGNSDIALNTKGQKLADALGKQIALRGGLDILYSSPLPRAVETADAIIENANTSIKRASPLPALCPWHLGEYEGRMPDAVHNLIDGYIAHPDEAPPGKCADGSPSESFNSAKNRQLSCLKKLYEDWAEQDPTLKIGVVMHSRGMELLQSWVDEDCPEDFDLKDSDLVHPDDPEHATMLRWHKDNIKDVDLDDDAPLTPGVYLILHSLTDDDTDEGNPELTKRQEREEAIHSVVKKYLPPLEVHQAAKRAYDVGMEVIDITAPLAEGEGLPVSEIQKIADHFAETTSITEPQTTRDAWGGKYAAKWAARVFKKAAKDFPEWQGIDLDGTLCEPTEPYDSTKIGKPIDAMVAHVKSLLAEGKTIKIFTARVADDPDGKVKAAIEAWCKSHLGQVLPVTNEKDPGMMDLIDDRSHRPEEVTKAGDGVMVALWPDPDTAKQIAVKDGESSDDLHITLAYFGKSVDADKLPFLEAALKHFAETHSPIKLQLGGLGRFPATPSSDGQDVAYLGVHSPEIQKFRQDLVDSVKGMGVDPKANFGYNPHMTLKFVAPHAPHLLPTPDSKNLKFTEIVLSVGTEKKVFPLTGLKSAVTKNTDEFEISGDIIKVDKDRQMVWGWFSIVSVNGKPFADSQGDVITPETIEESAYDFVLNARKGGEMHEAKKDGDVEGVGRLIESVVFTDEKQKVMQDSLREQGIDAVLALGCVAWWGGMHIDDSDTWDKVKTGKLRAWSIGGRGKRASL